jgi:beta-phosphoglucomutase family hydrolase
MTHGTDTIDLTRFQAALFDLDGVLTKTAVVHAHAWRQLFDAYLKTYAGRTGSAVEPFDIEHDYHTFVDGKPRYEGVKSFLESRGLELPWGSQDDGPDKDTIYGLGNKKDRYFEAQMREQGVMVYESTVCFLKSVRRRGMQTAVVSSSKHCKEVLEMAGLTALFETRVDGVELQRLQLRGKPAPDTFLEAARRLGVAPSKALVIEDAQVGVEAARAGGFGLVIALDRQRQADVLRQSGADIVVGDLTELFPEECSPAEPSVS